MRTLYKFTAPWCAPCKTVSKMLDQVLPEFPDIQVVEVDITKDVPKANEAGVKSVPVLLLGNRRLANVPAMPALRQFLKGEAF